MNFKIWLKNFVKLLDEEGNERMRVIKEIIKDPSIIDKIPNGPV